MGVVKNIKNKNKKDKKNANGKSKNDNEKVKKKKTVSCLQCIKPVKDGGLEGKYRVAAPELMQDTFMSDSEDEGGEVECPIQQQQQYRYMNSEAGTLHRAKPLEDSVTDGHLWPSNNDKKVATIERQPVDIGFLVSFVVDARGGAMKAKRRGGVRVIVPPAACAAPTRVTCRAATRRAPAASPPPLMEGEALASRLLELQPQGAKFLAPVIIEVPIFTAACKEREIVILRSDNGETWQDHYLHVQDNPLIQEALLRDNSSPRAECPPGAGCERVARVFTCDFPHYLACVSRVRQEVHVIGPDGGTVSSRHIPQVQALFPAAALTKRIRVGLQAHGAAPAQARRVLPRHAAASPVITVEPRRRKFHRSITLTVPLPAPQDGSQEKPPTSNLRLLCSIMGGQARAVWEDVTGSTPLTLTEDCASFTTTVSARFWLISCQNVSDATKLATELYREMLLVPFEVRIVVLGKRLDALEGRLLVMYITDRYAYETLLQQEHYTEVAHSTSVRFLDGKEVYLEFSGNLVPVTKSGSQPMFTFEAFKDNRVEFTVRVKHHEENPSGRIYFMNEPKVAKGEQSQTPACVLDVELPDRIAPRAAKSQLDYLNLDQSGFDALKDELSFHWGEHNNSHGPGSLPYHPDKPVNGHDKIITNGDVKYPTKDTDNTDIKDTKPQVNGNTVHVDSNKIKATFDSDEDKTPMNTLEKGKKKEGGFLGGLADKVKNVFGHSEDKEDEKESKESSPKPQPKPRESKEKTPPKPTPRIINEDLLDKVEDMFKDLHSKPPVEDELESQVYKTKLVVDEDAPHEHDKDDLYEQYALMQPVDTPIVNKTSDPFQFYIGCCEGKYMKGQRHRHDETSNVVDRIEQEKFAAQEKLSELAEGANKEIVEGLDKLEKEKDNIAQKSGEVAEEIFVKTDAIKGDIKKKGEDIVASGENKIHELKDATNDKLNEASESAQNLHDNVNAKAAEIQSHVATEIDSVISAAKDTVDKAKEKTSEAKNDVEKKAHELDFLAREKAEELRLRGQENLTSLENTANNTANNVKHAAQDGANAVTESIHSVQNNLSNKAQDVKAEAEKAKEAANEKAQEVSQSVENAKAKAKEDAKKAKKEAKKKAKEGKNFFTGLVSNIFGEKEKIENEVKDKIAETKESANEIVDQAAAKKDEIKDSLAKKEEELKDGAENVVQRVQDKTQEFSQSLSDKKDEIEKSVHDKADEAKNAVESKTEEVKSAVRDKANEIKDAAQEKAHEIQDAVNEKKNEAKSAINEANAAIHDKTAELKDAASEKVNDVQQKATDVADAIHDKTKQAKNAVSITVTECKDSIEEEASEIKDAVQNKVNEASNAVHETTEALSQKKDEIEQTWNDKKVEAQNVAQTEMDRIWQEAEQTTEEIKRKAEDTINAAAYKKTELQTSVNNKFDDLQQAGKQEFDDLQKSTKLALDDAQESTLSTFDKVESSAKDRVNDAKDTWEDLQSSTRDTYADMKDDVHSLGNSAQDTLHSFQSSAGNTFDSLDDSAREIFGNVQSNVTTGANELFGEAKESFEGFQVSADNKLEEVKGGLSEGVKDVESRLGDVALEVSEGAKGAEQVAFDAVASEADSFTSNLNNLGNSVFGSSGKGLMKDSSTKLLESEKAQSSPHKKSSGIPKLKKKNKK